MKAYKIFNNDWTCRGFKYEIGKTYTFDGILKLCPTKNEAKNGYGGFHACKNLSDCFRYYDCVPWNKIAEVELIGDIKGQDADKQVTNKIKIIDEIPFEDIDKIIKSNLIQGVSDSQGVSWSQGVSDSQAVSDSRGVS